MAPRKPTPTRSAGTLARVAGILAWSGFTLLVTLSGVELLVRVGDLFAVPRAFTRATDDVSNQAGEGGVDAPVSKRVPHPYLGWVHRPGYARVNGWGFPSRIADYRQVREEEMIVAVTGGSVALGMLAKGDESLVEGLAEARPDLRGKIRLLNFSLGGYKQPQQLYSVAQAMLVGVPIDAVINLDGFNEVALGEFNAKRGFHPFFPRAAYWLQATGFASGELTPAQIEGMAVALAERRKLEQWRARLEGGLLARSELFRVWAGVRMLRSQSAAVEAEGRVVSEGGEDGGERGTDRLPAILEAMDPACHGPGCDADVIRVWVEGSRLLHDLCRSRGIAYLHALQPNQYAAPAKVLTEEELALAWDPDRPWARSAQRLFPGLRVAAETELAANGVPFLDLTSLFEHETATVYADTCCHFNEAGYAAIGRALGQELARVYSGLPVTTEKISHGGSAAAIGSRGAVPETPLGEG